MQKSNGIVPEWAYKMDVHKPVEYFDNEYADNMNVPSFILPSVSQQWKDDMNRRIKAMKRWGKTSNDFRWRAPEEFIKTGRWPKNVKRPVTATVSQLEKEKGV
tara:strand:- start:114 stop:422 length:309 start_codon:yes stop_codon:yes gene_type:complete